ncbi:hypothetical protein BDZ97DRAFT_1840920, partial [Flammula alnicola]
TLAQVSLCKSQPSGMCACKCVQVRASACMLGRVHTSVCVSAYKYMQVRVSE